MENLRKIVSLMAAVYMLLGIWQSMTAKAAEDKLVVEGDVTLSGGNRSMEDVLITIKHDYMTDRPVVGTDRPNANGRYAIETATSSMGFLTLTVVLSLPGYDNYSPSSNIYPGQNTAGLLLVTNGPPTTYGISGTITMSGATLPSDLCPIVNFKVPAITTKKELQAYGGNYFYNDLAGNKVIITPHFDSYAFTPESITIEKIGRVCDDANFVMTPNGTAEIPVVLETPDTPDAPALPESTESTEAARNTITLYFMTGSFLANPGKVFEQFEVAKNSRGNTTTPTRTIKSRTPIRDGYKSDYWQESKLGNPTVLGSHISTVIWTNDTDQYIYVQCTEIEEPPTSDSTENTVTPYFMTGPSPSDPGGIFKQFEVAKNSKDSTTALTKAIKSRTPQKDGLKFNYWQEAKLSGPTVPGSRLYTVVWINGADQYTYAQYR